MVSPESIKAESVTIVGGSGFVGSRLVASFGARGFRVRATSRRARATGDGAVEWVGCDVLDRESVREAVRGATVVVSSFIGDRRTQVEGTRNLCDAALAEGTRRVLHLSTASVYGSATGQLDETAPLLRQGWQYADSKIEAEEVCADAARRGLHVTVFRPSVVYGPGSETWVVEIGNWLSSGFWGSLGKLGEGTCNLIYVDDLVAALALAVDAPIPAGEAFNVNGPDTVTWNEFFELMNEELGLPPLRTWSRAETVARAGFGLLPRAAKALARRLPSPKREPAPGRPPLRVLAPTDRRSSRERLVSLLRATPRLQNVRGQYPRRVVYLDDKARRLLAYRPEVAAQEGIRRSAAWYRAEQEAT
ncbi:MAG TPA: NAD-dependent epimerase/dehydratase family protein [Polyangiaceae bacterium]